MANHVTKEQHEEKEKTTEQGENEAMTNNQFNPLIVEEGEIIVSEENNDEGRDDQPKNLASNSIHPISPRNESIEVEMTDSPPQGGYWAERVKQSRVSTFNRSLEASSNGSQEIPETAPNTRGRKSERYHR